LRPFARWLAIDDISTIAPARRHQLERLLREQHVAAHVDRIVLVPRLRRHLRQRQPRRNSDIQHQPVEAAELLRAMFQRRRDGRGVANVDNVCESFAAFGCNLRHGIVGRILVDIDTGDMRTFARKQHRHRAAIADRRILVDDLALAGADHDDAAAGEAAVGFGLAEGFGVDRGGWIELLRRVGGD
jgi:hypothetical protein